jgi:SAM-dependent methyltransferase
VSASSRFAPYYESVEGRPPRPTLLFALDRWQAEHIHARGGFAVDLGCGAGRDTFELLRRGFRVRAIDPEPEAIAALTARTDLPNRELLEPVCARMEDAELPACDIVNASFSLPLCPPDRFPQLWSWIVTSLQPGGRFAGQFYGPEDEWANPGLTIVTREELDALLVPFDVELLEEIKRVSETGKGKMKRWHLFNIAARKRAAQ